MVPSVVSTRLSAFEVQAHLVYRQRVWSLISIVGTPNQRSSWQIGQKWSGVAPMRYGQLLVVGQDLNQAGSNLEETVGTTS